MRQIVCAWHESHLLILWDNDIRDSLMSIPFNSQEAIYAHIAGLTNGWKIDGFDVESQQVKVLNPTDAHESWVIDFDAKDDLNAIVFTLI